MEMVRYQKLELREALGRTFHYPIACRELGLILRNAYSELPKNLQSLILQDTLAAFRLLPEVQTQSAISAANALLHSAEVVLPKQKRGLAIAEYKQAMVAFKRRSKTHQENEGLAQLPQDVLAHIFSFLDLQSLLSSASVCRSWSVVARDQHLWKALCINFLGASYNQSKIIRKSDTVIKKKDLVNFHGDTVWGFSIDWKEALKRACKGISLNKYTSYRGYCLECSSIVWLDNFKCYNTCLGEKCTSNQIKPVSTEQIVHYILDNSLSESSSDSDSDSDDGSHLKLWAYPRQVSESPND